MLIASTQSVVTHVNARKALSELVTCVEEDSAKMHLVQKIKSVFPQTLSGVSAKKALKWISPVTALTLMSVWYPMTAILTRNVKM